MFSKSTSRKALVRQRRAIIDHLTTDTSENVRWLAAERLKAIQWALKRGRTAMGER